MNLFCLSLFMMHSFDLLFSLIKNWYLLTLLVWYNWLKKKVIFFCLFILEITKFGQHRLIFTTINNSNVFFCYTRRKYYQIRKILYEMLSKIFCLENFSHILGHLKFFVFPNNIFVINMFYAKTPYFHVHEK